MSAPPVERTICPALVRTVQRPGFTGRIALYQDRLSRIRFPAAKNLIRQRLLRSIRRGLHDDGVYICLDINCSENLEDNAGPLGAMFHGFSIGYCMTTSLAHDGAGLGTLGFHEAKVRELSADAGFSSVRLASENPFNKLYEIRP